MVIGIGITAAVGGGVYYAYQEQADLFSSNTQLEVRNLNVVRSGDTFTVSANIKNVGSTAITGISINSIVTGNDFAISDPNKGDGALNVRINAHNTNATTATTTHTTSATQLLAGYEGFSIGASGDRSSLDGGASHSLQFSVRNTASGAEISRAVTISDRVNLQLAYDSGNDSFLTDIYNTRVKPG